MQKHNKKNKKWQYNTNRVQGMAMQYTKIHVHVYVYNIIKQEIDYMQTNNVVMTM